MSRSILLGILFITGLVTENVDSRASENLLESYYHQSGPMEGMLKSDSPLPLFDSNPDHLWNRLYSLLYIRPRAYKSENGQDPVVHYEGGDVIEFLAWTKTRYWSSDQMFHKMNSLLDEFLKSGGEKLITDPLKRAVFQHDLWAAYDHLMHQNMIRSGNSKTRKNRLILCEKFAKVMKKIALNSKELSQLPDTYAAAVNSGSFVPEHQLDPYRNYLPAGLMNSPNEWVEMDFYYPDMHEDISDRFVSLHARSVMGRSYYRIFYRFPEGRPQLEAYLKKLEKEGIDWKYAAQFGFVRFNKNVPQIPIGTEVVLLQLMMTMDDQLHPVPTKIVESFQFRMYRNLDGSNIPDTNTDAGINVLDYRLKRHLLFENLKSGGLERELEHEPQYRVVVDGLHPKAKDWGFPDKELLFKQCVDCHLSPKHERPGVLSIPSMVHSGGFNAGAQMGVAQPVDPENGNIRGIRVARYKNRHETFRRLIEFLE